MSVSLTYNPNITAEVARRRAEGLDLGDARKLAEHEDRERNLGVSHTQNLARLALNWDGSKATTAKVGLLGDTTTLYCNNCYFFLNAAVTMNLKVCAIWSTGLGGYTYYYDPSVPAANTYGVYYASSCSTAAGNAGCVQTSDAQARAATDCAPSPGGLGTRSPSIFNLGMSIEAYFSGSAGFNFEIKSDGIAAAKTYPSTCTKAASNGDSFAEGLKASGSKCLASSLPAPFDNPVTLPTITVSVAAVPVQLDTEILLKGAGYVEATMPNFKLSFGASAAVACKLGGKVSFTEIPSNYIPVLDTVIYKDFTATYSTLPFVLSGFDKSALATDITFTPQTTLKVWKAIPIYTSPIYQMKYSLTTGSSARRLGYSLSAFRNLQTCSSGLNSAAAVKGAIGVALGPVKTFDAVKAVTAGIIDLDTKTSTPGVSGFNVDLIPFTILADPSSNALAATGALSSDATSKCVTVGQSVSTGGSTSAGGGGGGGGGGFGAPASDNGAPLALGLALGLGLVAPLLVVGFILYFRYEEGQRGEGKSAPGAHDPARAVPRAEAGDGGATSRRGRASPPLPGAFPGDPEGPMENPTWRASGRAPNLDRTEIPAPRRAASSPARRQPAEARGAPSVAAVAAELREAAARLTEAAIARRETASPSRRRSHAEQDASVRELERRAHTVRELREHVKDLEVATEDLEIGIEEEMGALGARLDELRAQRPPVGVARESEPRGGGAWRHAAPRSASPSRRQRARDAPVSPIVRLAMLEQGWRR
jgi:hypothetical protein